MKHPILPARCLESAIIGLLISAVPAPADLWHLNSDLVIRRLIASCENPEGCLF